jgi:site-specific recombinase XerD
MEQYVTITHRTICPQNTLILEDRTNAHRSSSLVYLFLQSHQTISYLTTTGSACWQDHDYVFCTLTGTHLRPNHVVDEFKKLLKKAELPDIRFHDLRHSAATLLLSLGVHLKVVQELLGHTQISMTMDIYSHVLPGLQQDAVGKLNTLLTRPKDGDVGKGGKSAR